MLEEKNFLEKFADLLTALDRLYLLEIAHNSLESE
jgi:hypothetical protein